jgi:benzoylformate decarboxylase
MKNKITGRSAFLALLKDEGITHLFGNPGTTELPIMHALKDHPDLTYVMAMQESLVVAIADGYSRASGKLVACNVHVAPGLGNAMGSLYNAQFTGTPMILTAGQQEQGHGLMEPVLYGPLVRMAEPLVKWAVEVTRLEDLPRIVRRAAKVAMTPPTGPVFISLPGDILNSEAGIDLGRSTRIDARTRPSDEALRAFAARLLKAERPVIVTMDEVVKSDALQEAAELAELLGAAAYQSSTPYGSHFLSESPSFVGTLARVQKVARDTLAPYDLLIALGGDPLRMSVYSEVDALPDGLGIVQVGLADWEIAKNYGAEIALKADVKETLRALIPVLKEMGGATLASRAKQRLAELASSSTRASPPAARSRRCVRIATAMAITALPPAASAGACPPPSVPALPIRIVPWCAFPATAARCIRSSRCGRRHITSCRSTSSSPTMAATASSSSACSPSMATTIMSVWISSIRRWILPA